VDASVAVKWFVDEEHADEARALLDHFRQARCRVAIPGWLFFLEISNALRRKGFSEEDVSDVLVNLWRYRIGLVEARTDLTAKTNAIAYGYRASIYDSAYVAVAEVMGFPLVTADEELLKCMKGHSIVLPIWELEFQK